MRFVLVGDSGQRDPEVFGDLARRYPANPLDLRSDLSDLLRWRDTMAFAGIDRRVWQVFPILGRYQVIG